MKRSLPSLLLGAMLLAACSQPAEPYIHRHHAVDLPQPPPSIPSHVRYHRTEVMGDTLRVTWPTPDKALVMRYVYVHDHLRWIDVFDYAGRTAENALDFDPKFYQILVDGRTAVPGDLRLM